MINYSSKRSMENTPQIQHTKLVVVNNPNIQSISNSQNQYNSTNGSTLDDKDTDYYLRNRKSNSVGSSTVSKMSTQLSNGKDVQVKERVKVKKNIRNYVCQVTLLNEEALTIDLKVHKKHEIMGSLVFNKLCQQLNLIEQFFFHLTFKNKNNEQVPLNLDKPLFKQVSKNKLFFNFETRFYSPYPSKFEEDVTRYFLCQQIRRDLLTSKLSCSFLVYALLGGLTVQSEIGDFDAEKHATIDYLQEYMFAPKQSITLLEKVRKVHRKTKGMTPSEADLLFLENASKLPCFGEFKYPGKDNNGRNVIVGISSIGICVYMSQLRIQRYIWARILVISFSQNFLYIKLRPIKKSMSTTTVVYKLKDRATTKIVWKIAADHHTFFRMGQSDNTIDSRGFGLFKGRHRFSGRTFNQCKDVSIITRRENPTFNRAPSVKMSKLVENADTTERYEIYATKKHSFLLHNHQNLTAPVASNEEDITIDEDVVNMESNQSSENLVLENVPKVNEQHVDASESHFEVVQEDETVNSTFISSQSVESGNTIIDTDKFQKKGINGLETIVESKTVLDSADFKDNEDFEEAMIRAITNVTGLNTDLSVEKIEIRTKSEPENTLV